jgi:hypothetical protein
MLYGRTRLTGSFSKNAATFFVLNRPIEDAPCRDDKYTCIISNYGRQMALQFDVYRTSSMFNLSACTRFYIFVRLQGKTAILRLLASTCNMSAFNNSRKIKFDILVVFYVFCGYILIVVQVLEQRTIYTKTYTCSCARL